MHAIVASDVMLGISAMASKSIHKLNLKIRESEPSVRVASKYCIAKMMHYWLTPLITGFFHRYADAFDAVYIKNAAKVLVGFSFLLPFFYFVWMQSDKVYLF